MVYATGTSPNGIELHPVIAIEFLRLRKVRRPFERFNY